MIGDTTRRDRRESVERLMHNALPPHLEKERAAVEALIRSAFAGVTREGGVSWSETYAIDGFKSMSDRAEARASDKDTSWEWVADDPSWTPNVSFGGFCFLDAVGFRYYIAPAMLWSLRGNPSSGVIFALTMSDSIDESYFQEQWALISSEQARCIAHFLRFMEARDLARGADIGAEYWRRALDGHWHKFESGSAPPDAPSSVD